MSGKSASEFLAKLSKSRSSKVDWEGLAEALTDEWHGVKGLAKSVRQDYLDSAQGSMNRSRIMTSVMEVIGKATAKAQANDPFKDMSPEDMAPVIAQMLKEANASDSA